MKKVLLIVAALALAVPVYANILTNGNFENGLTGWTVVQDLAPWGGSVQTPVQTANTNNPLRVMKGVMTEVDFHFEDTGATVATGVPLNQGTSAGVSRAGWKAAPGASGDPLEGTWSWVSQSFVVAPGEYYVLAEWDTFSYSTGGDYSQGVVLMAFGDDPYDGQPWDVGYYGNDNNVAEPPRTRASAWNHQTPAGNWTHKSWSVASNKKITTYSGNVEFRWVFKDKAPNSEITDLTLANYSLLDNASADLQLIRLVPEPSSVLALATGLLGLGGLALRRRR